MTAASGKVWVITGTQETGKTRFCTHLIKKARIEGLQVGGVVSPPVYENGIKTAIEVEELRSGEKRILARKRENELESVQTKRWTFDADVLAWGNNVLAQATPCDVLVVDELGLLEFERGGGWQNGFSAVLSGEYRLALVVVRPHLVEQAQALFIDSRVMEIPPKLDTSHEQELMNLIFLDLGNQDSFG